MMIVGAMSDSHGNIGMMQRAADLMVERFRAEAIVHLGDDYADAMRLDTHGRPLYAVPGMYEAAWNDLKISHRLIKEFGGITFLISHTQTRDRHDRHGDINPGRALSRYGAQVLLHGHTHSYRAEKAVDGLVVINPGHLKADSDRGSPPTFAVIDARDPVVSVRFLDLEGCELGMEEFKVAMVPLPTPSEEPAQDDDISIG